MWWINGTFYDFVSLHVTRMSEKYNPCNWNMKWRGSWRNDKDPVLWCRVGLTLSNWVPEQGRADTVSVSVLCFVRMLTSCEVESVRAPCEHQPCGLRPLSWYDNSTSIHYTVMSMQGSIIPHRCIESTQQIIGRFMISQQIYSKWSLPQQQLMKFAFGFYLFAVRILSLLSEIFCCRQSLRS